MSLQFTAVDNGSKSVTFTATPRADELWPSGTVATILGMRWNGLPRSEPWKTLGTITDPATTLTVTLDSYGAWFFAAHTPTMSEISAPFILPVVNADDSFFTQCEESIAATITRLNLEGIKDRVYSQTVPHDDKVKYPCVFVTSSEDKETVDSGGLNATADIGHPFKVMIALRGSVKQEVNRTRLAGWRQLIWSAFDTMRLIDVPRVKYCKVEFGPRVQLFAYPTEGGQPAYRMMASVLTIRCFVRQLRGFGQ